MTPEAVRIRHGVTAELDSEVDYRLKSVFIKSEKTINAKKSEKTITAKEK